MRWLLAAAAGLLPLLVLPSPLHGEVVQDHGTRLSVTASVLPHALPRQGREPAAVSVSGAVSSPGSSVTPQLRRILLELNAHGRISTRGVPICRRDQIDPATSRAAKAACPNSLVGSGSFRADVRLPEQTPFPSRGRILAFNGHFRGRPAILVHIYGTQPAPTSYVLPFLIRHQAGTYGTRLEASLPALSGDWGFVEGLSLTLGRSQEAPAAAAYVTADCPAPPGLRVASFPLVRTTFSFESGFSLTTAVVRTCRVRLKGDR